MAAIHVLHVTAHLGGGVGKVLSRLVEQSARSQDGIQHTIATLEAPEKSQFADHVETHGGKLVIRPTFDELNRLAASADIVQLEWWHHPAMAAWMCSGNLPPMRLIIWSHVSGLHPPQILPDFVRAPHRFLFTSPCSLEHSALSQLEPDIRQRIGVVFSSGGFDDLPNPARHPIHKQLRAGYVGTLNFAKLHPQLMDYLAAVDLPEFRLSMVGDPTTGKELEAQAKHLGMDDRIELCGYRTNIAETLAGFDVFVYLLNPLHYGTTENALLEAMAMGVVPIVMDNPAERQLVRDGETGLRITSPQHFADALRWLVDNPEHYLRLAKNAAAEVRHRFSVDRTCNGLDTHYTTVVDEEKKSFDFCSIFGQGPADWFRSCQGEQIWRFPDRLTDIPACILEGPHYLYELTKGSVFHYHRAFPDDPRLAAWSRNLNQRRTQSN
ncbi:glycosyltransferase family 4 protein [Azonexus sp.]|uniref:glycosyltransferase family 4 protein n=1 Tax=Azonexus sp. TaxID=1872668 RepID=UPI0027BB1BA9|nr:glycosyltransferase family 4 protein [Azonexus sp.]